MGVARRPWTADADDALLAAVTEHGPKWDLVAVAVGDATGVPRTGHGCRMRYVDQRRALGWPAPDPAKRHRPRFESVWTPELDAALLDGIRRGMSYPKIARQMKRSAHSIKNRVAALHATVPIAAIRAGYTPAPEDQPDKMWAAAKQATERGVEKHKTQRLATVTVPTALPIGISVISDQHIRESGPIQLTRMEEDARLVAATPGLFAVLGGDGCDNHLKHHAAMVHGGSAPSHEWQLFEHYLGFFGDKILAVISGNHDDWTSDFAGVSYLQRIVQDKRLFFAPDEVLLDVEVGGQTYRLKVRHQYRFNSAFNNTHSVKRMWEMGDDPFDIGVVCHHHAPGLEPFWKHGLVRWAARPGSYQLTSGYGRRYGHTQPVPTCPTFILWPGDRRIVGFVDVREAAEYLTLLRGKAA